MFPSPRFAAGTARGEKIQVVEDGVDRRDVRADDDRSVAQIRADLVDCRESNGDRLGAVEELRSASLGVANEEEMAAAGRVRRIDDELGDELRWVAGVSRLFGKLPSRAVDGRLAFVDRPRGKFEKAHSDAVLVLLDEDDALIARQGEDHREPARFADEVVVDAYAVGELDLVAPQPEVGRLDDDLRAEDVPVLVLAFAHHAFRVSGGEQGIARRRRIVLKGCRGSMEERAIEPLRIGTFYHTTYGTLWKDGTYFPCGTRVQIVGLHLDQGFCLRFPVDVDGEPLETWEGWSEIEFLAEDGSVDGRGELSPAALDEARAVLAEAEDGCHLHIDDTPQ